MLSFTVGAIGVFASASHITQRRRASFWKTNEGRKTSYWFLVQAMALRITGEK
jgi:hypothetical protein